jgi:uncharacterized membrane protein
MFDFSLLLSAIILLSVDFVYLRFAKNYFENQIKLVQGSPVKINIFGVLFCYLFLIIGLNYFIIKPKKDIYDAFLFGLVIYAVYEGTNYALFKNWSILTVIMDTLWGGILFALTTFLVNRIKMIF